MADQKPTSKLAVGVCVAVAAFLAIAFLFKDAKLPELHTKVSYEPIVTFYYTDGRPPRVRSVGKFYDTKGECLSLNEAGRGIAATVDTISRVEVECAMASSRP